RGRPCARDCREDRTRWWSAVSRSQLRSGSCGPCTRKGALARPYAAAERACHGPRLREFLHRPTIVRHDPGLAASPHVRYTLKMAGGMRTPASFISSHHRTPTRQAETPCPARVLACGLPVSGTAGAAPADPAVLPDANVPASIRGGDGAVVHGSASELRSIVDAWLAGHAEGTACVIGDPSFEGTSRVRS